MTALIRSIEERINRSGLGRPAIQQLGENRLLVQLPGVEDLDRAKSLIGETAQLEYKKRTLNVPAALTIADQVVAIEVKKIGGATSTEDTIEDDAADNAEEANENSTSTEAQLQDNTDNTQAIPALVMAALLSIITGSRRLGGIIGLILVPGIAYILSMPDTIIVGIVLLETIAAVKIIPTVLPVSYTHLTLPPSDLV